MTTASATTHLGRYFELDLREPFPPTPPYRAVTYFFCTVQERIRHISGHRVMQRKKSVRVQSWGPVVRVSWSVGGNRDINVTQ